MEIQVRIGAETISLKKKIAEGGEARIFKIDDQTVAKVYRLPSDQEFSDDEAQISAARIRVVVAQRKLPLFPKDLPATVVSPITMIRSTTNDFIIGYTMPFIKNSRTIADFNSPSARSEGITDKDIIEIFGSLRVSVRAVHDRGIVIGDFNDNNVLAKDNVAFLIDMDSAQYGPFRGRVFMPEFVDPNRCDPNAKSLELIKLHDEESDWYAWWTMLFQSLHWIHPYGGIYRPQDKTKRIPAAVRGLPQHRVSVYHPEVIYPAQARPLDAVPETLQRFFRMVFVDGLRPEPPESLLRGLKFRSDGNFDCVASAMALPKKVASASKKVVARGVVATSGSIILYAAAHSGQLTWIDYAGGQLLRDGKPLFGLKKVDGLTIFAAGRQVALAHRDEALVCSDAWKKRVSVGLHIGTGCIDAPMAVGSSCGVVYWDGAFKMLVGAKDPMVRVLDIEKL